MQIGMTRAETRRFSEGLLDTIELRRGAPLHAHLIEFNGTFTADGAPGDGAIRSDAVFQLLRQVRVTANNRPIQTWDGRFLRPYHKLMDPAELIQTPPTAITDETSQAIRAFYLIPYFMGHSLQGEEFALRRDRSGITFALELQWGTAADMISGLENAVAIENGEVKIYELPVQGANGGFPPHIVQRYAKEVAQSGALTLELNNLEPGMEIARIFIEGLSGGSNGRDFVQDDDVVTQLDSFELNDVEKMEGIPFSTLQTRNARAYQLSSRETGVAVIDGAENSRTEFGQLYRVTGPNPRLELQVSKESGDCKVVAHVVGTAGRGNGSAGRGR